MNDEASAAAAVNAIAVTCGNCGAGLELPPDARFVTCTYCGSRLELHRSGGAAYTKVLDDLKQHAERIADDVGRIRMQNELEQLDREWMIRREGLMVTGKHGARHVPGKFGTIFGALIAVVFLIFWIGIASSMGAPGFFVLFGVIGLVAAVGGAIHHFAKADQYAQAERDYNRRRAELVRKMDGGG